MTSVGMRLQKLSARSLKGPRCDLCGERRALAVLEAPGLEVDPDDRQGWMEHFRVPVPGRRSCVPCAVDHFAEAVEAGRAERATRPLKGIPEREALKRAFPTFHKLLRCFGHPAWSEAEATLGELWKRCRPKKRKRGKR